MMLFLFFLYLNLNDQKSGLESFLNLCVLIIKCSQLVERKTNFLTYSTCLTKLWFLFLSQKNLASDSLDSITL